MWIWNSLWESVVLGWLQLAASHSLECFNILGSVDHIGPVGLLRREFLLCRGRSIPLLDDDVVYGGDVLGDELTQVERGGFTVELDSIVRNLIVGLVIDFVVGIGVRVCGGVLVVLGDGRRGGEFRGIERLGRVDDTEAVGGGFDGNGEVACDLGVCGLRRVHLQRG